MSIEKYMPNIGSKIDLNKFITSCGYMYGFLSGISLKELSNCPLTTIFWANINGILITIPTVILLDLLPSIAKPIIPVAFCLNLVRLSMKNDNSDKDAQD